MIHLLRCAEPNRQDGMGSTALRKPLEVKMGHWAAEAHQLADEIARIESLFERLDSLRERADHLDHVLSCASVIMKEINPDWNDDQLKPIKKHVHKAPGRPGEVARLTLDVLREVVEPLPTRTISERVFERLSHAADDKEQKERVYRSVEATLRAKLADGLVRHDGTYGRKWEIAV